MATKKKAPPKRAKKVQPIPTRFHVVTAAFRTRGCASAIEFLEKAFGARIRDRYDGPGGTVLHAEVKIGDSVVMCGEAGNEPFGPFPLFAMIYVKDADAVFRRAIGAGASIVRPLTDQFYGDRNGTVRDAWGNEWTISTHKEDVSRKEMLRRMAAM